jgi:hypothetical protein
MSSLDYLSAKYGFKIAALPPRIVSVGTTATEVLKSNPKRVMFQVINISSYDMYFSFLPNVSSTNGIPVVAYGGGVISRLEEDMEYTTFPAYMISPSGTGSVYILENVRY